MLWSMLCWSSAAPPELGTVRTEMIVVSAALRRTGLVRTDANAAPLDGSSPFHPVGLSKVAPTHGRVNAAGSGCRGPVRVYRRMVSAAVKHPRGSSSCLRQLV